LKIHEMFFILFFSHFFRMTVWKCIISVQPPIYQYMLWKGIFSIVSLNLKPTAISQKAIWAEYFKSSLFRKDTKTIYLIDNLDITNDTNLLNKYLFDLFSLLLIMFVCLFILFPFFLYLCLAFFGLCTDGMTCKSR